MLKQEDKFAGTPLGRFDTQYVLKKNDMGLVPLFWVWVDWVHDAARLAFPNCYTELSVAPITETPDEMFRRLTSDIPHMPLLDEWDDCLDDADMSQLWPSHRAKGPTLKLLPLKRCVSPIVPPMLPSR